MAAPTYSEDLTDINLAESTTGWAALGGGASGLSASPDLAMEGTNCVDKQITGAEKGQVFDNSGNLSLSSGQHVFVWLFVATPGLIAEIASRGVTVVLGSLVTAYCQYHVEGLSTYGAGGRVGKCYPIDYTVYSSNTGSSPYRTVTGSPSGSVRVVGGTINVTGTVKGANLGVDGLRYGTGAFIKDGEEADPATFAGFAAADNTKTVRWGILTALAGSYELQGKFVIGQTNAGVAAACYFADADRNIVIVDTVHAKADFTQIIVDHASTTCILTNINITALGTTNPGRFIVNSADPVVTITGGTWTGLALVTLRSNTTVEGVIFRQTGQITLNQATLTDCDVIENSGTSAVVTDDLADLDNCSFESDGTGHAVELTSVGGGSMNWKCNDTGYAASDGSTGDETIYVNVGAGSLTITVVAGYTTPTIRTAGATVSVVSGAVDVTVTVTDVGGTEIDGANVFLAADDGGLFPYEETVTISNSGTTANVTHTGHGMDTGDKVLITGASLVENNGVFTITKDTVDTYHYTMGSAPGSSPTGTILATFVFLKGLTEDGVITMSRKVTSAQPVYGWARKSTGTPLYKTGLLGGEVDSGAGASLTAILIADE